MTVEKQYTKLFLEGKITRKKYLSLTNQTPPRCKKDTQTQLQSTKENTVRNQKK